MITYITPYGDTPPPEVKNKSKSGLFIGVGAAAFAIVLSYSGMKFLQSKTHVRPNTGQAQVLTPPTVTLQRNGNETNISWQKTKNKGYISSIVVHNYDHYPKNQSDGVPLGSSSSGMLVTNQDITGFISVFNLYNDGRTTLAGQAH